MVGGGSQRELLPTAASALEEATTSLDGYL